MDQTIAIPGLIVHRSAITHSALVVLAISLSSARLGPEVRRLVTSGAAVGLALHLVPDMLPEGWTGYALIHVPLLGKLSWVPFGGDWFPGVFSFCWLGANAVSGFWIALGSRVGIRKWSIQA